MYDRKKKFKKRKCIENVKFPGIIGSFLNTQLHTPTPLFEFIRKCEEKHVITMDSI